MVGVVWAAIGVFHVVDFCRGGWRVVVARHGVPTMLLGIFTGVVLVFVAHELLPGHLLGQIGVASLGVAMAGSNVAALVLRRRAPKAEE